MLFVDAVEVKVRDRQVRNTPFYLVMGVTMNGEREILGIWAGDGDGSGGMFLLRSGVGLPANRGQLIRRLVPAEAFSW